VGGERYRVDYEELGRFGRRLGDLSEELRNIEDLIGEYQWQVGHDGIADSLGEFADNWSHERGDIANQLDDLKDTAASAAEGYKVTDEGIADQVKSGTEGR
jgi:hypothetical protein